MTIANPEDLAKAITQYGPAIEAFIHFLQMHGQEKAAALSLDPITRGFRVAAQTGNTTLLKEAIDSHCDPISGCRLP